MEENKYDLAIIGSGSAGCSAAIYATRFNLKTVMFSGIMPGGLITEARDVENYPGYKLISGRELGQKFIDHAISLGAENKALVVNTIKKKKDIFIITADNSQYFARSIIIATGTHHRKLNIPGEQEYAGKGVSYCATCDGPFYKNKIVAVVGGGNTAVESAVELSENAKLVYIIRRSSFKAAPIYVDNLKKNKKVIDINNAVITEIGGNDFVEYITLNREYNGNKKLNIDGVFVQIGFMPMNNLAKSIGVEINEYGFVKIDEKMATNIDGVFVAGDLTTGSNMFHQQITSASEGAISAQSAYKYLLTKKQ